MIGHLNGAHASHRYRQSPRGVITCKVDWVGSRPRSDWFVICSRSPIALRLEPKFLNNDIQYEHHRWNQFAYPCTSDIDHLCPYWWSSMNVPTRVETSIRFPYREAMTTSSLELRAIEAHLPMLPEVETFSIDQDRFRWLHEQDQIHHRCKRRYGLHLTTERKTRIMGVLIG